MGEGDWTKRLALISSLELTSLFDWVIPFKGVLIVLIIDYLFLS